MGRFYEPWRCDTSTAWEANFRSPPTSSPVALEAWEAARDGAAKNAPVNIWGTEVFQPGHAFSYTTGEKVDTDGSGILVQVHHVGSGKGRMDAMALASRIVEAVNYCEGVNLKKTGFKNLAALLEDRDEAQARATKAEINQELRRKWNANGQTSR